MKFKNHIQLLVAVTVIGASMTFASCNKDDEAQQQPTSNKAERNFIREGNNLFAEENYADAEIAYSKALEANPSSATAAYNMALAMTKQAADGDTTGLLQRADSLFSYAASLTHDKKLKSMAYYNMGNIGYNSQRFDKAVNDYKNSLRCMPTDEDARYNLRMAQLKLQEQQQNNQNQDQNQNNQDQNQDQQNQDQDKQNQDQDKQNQDQNQQNQDQQQGKNQQSEQDKAKQDQGKQQQSGQGQGQQGKPINMDDRSVGQVLKAMQDKEKETQQKIYQMGERQRQRERQATRNKW